MLKQCFDLISQRCLVPALLAQSSPRVERQSPNSNRRRPRSKSRSRPPVRSIFRCCSPTKPVTSTNAASRVNITTLSATASAQALLSGQVDIYQGGTATIHANVGGSDLIYIAASVDRSTLVLFGQKGLTTFEGLRGKSVATTSVGAFGEIAMRKTAKERGMEIGKDIKLLYHKGPPDALSTFLVGNADGVIITPPQTEMARSKGFPVIIDFYEKGLKIIGPGTGVARAFMQKNPNTLKIFLMGYLDGVKRSLDDPRLRAKRSCPNQQDHRSKTWRTVIRKA